MTLVNLFSVPCYAFFLHFNELMIANYKMFESHTVLIDISCIWGFFCISVDYISKFLMSKVTAALLLTFLSVYRLLHIDMY